MKPEVFWWAGLLCVATAWGAERRIQFEAGGEQGCPPGFRSALAGEGPMGDWRVLLDEAPPDAVPTSGTGSIAAQRPVVAQLSQNATDERFPLLILDDEVFGDFTLTAKFKTVAGSAERMAGVAFRLQDERNFYVVRASTLGKNFRFYRVFNGARDHPVGVNVDVPSGAWHELAIVCKGNRIRLRLDGKELIPELTDNSFAEGKIALWTKSDSLSYFTDIKIIYTPRETLAKTLVRELMQEYPRLLELKVFATTPTRPELHVVASNDPKAVGQPAGQYEQAAIRDNAPYSGRGKGKVIVTLPVHDSNGYAVAVLRIVLPSYFGQTDQNALSRTRPILKAIEDRVRSLSDLTR